MKTEVKQFAEKASNKLRYVNALAYCAAVSALVSPAITYADVKGDSSGVKEIVTNILSIVVNIFPFVGGFFVVAGVFKLIMAYRNDQPEAQAGAARDIVIGAVFIVFRVFAWEPIKDSVLGKIGT